MPILRLAFDRTARTIDADGRLHINRSHISKAAVNPYYGKEIPGYEALGLDPNKVYRLLRDPVELERAAPSFARIPILKKHVPITVETMLNDEEQKKLIVGAIGSEISFNAPYLDADLCIWDAAAIAGIDTDTIRELSCAYRYVPVMTPGEYEGAAYDGIMTEIRGNHLALVEAGRAGSDVIVADHNPFKVPTMKMTKLGKALFASLCIASPVLAADAALVELVGTAAHKTFDRAATREKLMAMDASIDSTKLDAVLDAILDVEETPTAVEPPKPAADASPAEKLRALLSGKVDDETMEAACALMTPAADADPDDNSKEDDMKKDDVKAAMDESNAKLRKDLMEAAEAAREVRPTVGDVIGMDSAADVYGFALDHMKVDRKGVEGVAALRALYKIAVTKAPTVQAPAIAADAASLDTRFPAVKRFRQA